MAVEIISEFKLKNNLDFPIVDSNNIRGGNYQVNTLIERNQIPKERRKEGMLCYVKETDLHYILKNGNWETFIYTPSGIGLPVLDQEMIHNSGDKLPSKYLEIPNGLNGEITNNTYTTHNNGSYIDILFSAIRSLQSEVARLKNSFKYGINSYNDNKTAISESLGEIENPDEEPLWAVEEDSLSELHECTLTLNEHSNLFGDNIQINIEKNLLNIIGTAYFKDPENGFKKQSDPKSFIFLTTSNKNIIFDLVSNINSFLIDLNKIKCDLTTNSKYNILIIVSKKVAKGGTDIYGDDYVWIQIQDYITDKILASGYYNKTNELSSIKYSFDNLYFIDKIYFKDVELSKFNAYTKYLDFSKEVIPTYPDDSDYKFEAAHITIRSVKNENILKSVSEYLLNSELIWVENTKKLYIKSDNQLIEIGSNSKQNDDMTTEQLIGELKNLGIVVDDINGEHTLKLNNLTGVTFIHQDTGKKFNLEIDSEGNLRSTLEDNDTLKSRLDKVKITPTNSRGFISNLLLAEAGITSVDSNAGLNSDRLKIGSIYAPITERSLYGCSHAFVELENTSDKPFNLKGCYLHAAITKGNTTKVYSLPLTGTIPAGGTYLIRGKKYAEFEDKNTVLKVKTYDQEWYIDGELIDFQSDIVNFILLYNVSLVREDVSFAKKSSSKTWEIINSNFIDYAPVRNRNTSWISDMTWEIKDQNEKRDYILKNTFELDPAKQAFLALNSADSSRFRGKKGNDFKLFYIDSPIISFPHSEETYDISKYTPKASFEHKNVSTDKSKLNTEKPNMVYCSFGIDMHKTRCFNWISVGSFDEYVWVRTKGTLDWERFESYNEFTDVLSDGNLFSRKILTQNLNNYVYKRMQGRFPGDGSFYTAHKCILNLKTSINSEKQEYEYCVGRSLIDGNPDPNHTSEIMYFTIYPKNSEPRIYQITDLQGFNWIEYLTWAGSAEAVYNKIKKDIAESKNTIMPIIINTGDMTLNGTRVNEWIDYYRGGYCLFKEFEHMSVVGNNDLCNTNPDELGTGDDYGKSNGYYFHVFQCFEVEDEELIVNKKYVPSTYYIECQTGINNYFRLICVNSEITFINCKDWFKLIHTPSDTNDEVYNIYTGWVVGENSPLSKQTYISEEINGLTFTPIYNTLYKWMNSAKPNTRTIVACHEMPFTVMTNKNLTTGSERNYKDSRSLNGGTSLVGSHLNQININDNISNYWFSRLLEHFNIPLCIGGHKHTYTCTYPVREFYKYKIGDIWYTSLEKGPKLMKSTLEDECVNNEATIKWIINSKEDSLLMNKLIPNNGIFSKLLDLYNVFFDKSKDFNTSRLPLVKFEGTLYKMSGDALDTVKPNAYTEGDLASIYLPIVGVPNLNKGVTYFMCLATGYKLTSNEELPGSSQAFTLLLPLTIVKDGKDKPSPHQQLPMFGIIKLSDKISILLLSVNNILKDEAIPLYNNEGEYAPISSKPLLKYMNSESEDYKIRRYGQWSESESNIVTL